MTAGYPTAQDTPDIMLGMEAGGAGTLDAQLPCRTAQEHSIDSYRYHRAGHALHRPHRRRPHDPDCEHCTLSHSPHAHTFLNTALTTWIQQALKNGINTEDVLQMIRDARKRGLKAPVMLMGYYNPLLSYGEERMLQDAKEAGANGFIMVDLPPEEALRFRNFCRSYG